ncbi:MAG TPA: hypothetical protein VKH37_06440, partial [Ferruginibacter sp.]|nr:hypothetical protein [Ferruginibacter sp.]
SKPEIKPEPKKEDPIPPVKAFESKDDKFVPEKKKETPPAFPVYEKPWVASEDKIDNGDGKEGIYRQAGISIGREDEDEDTLEPIPLVNSNDGEKRKKKILLMSLAAVVLAVLAFGGWYIWKTGKDSNTSDLQNQLNNVATDPAKKDSSIQSPPLNERRINIDSSTPITSPKNPVTVPVKTPDKPKDEPVVEQPKTDDFQYLTPGKVKNDLYGKQLCGGISYTGSGQTLTIGGNFPDQGTQRSISDNATIPIIVYYRDNEGNKCTIEVQYNKQGNKFLYSNYAQN